MKSRAEKQSQKRIEQKESRGRRKKIHPPEMLGKPGLGGSKSRLAKAAGAEVAVSLRHENLRAAVARSTCSSQNVQNTPFSDHFLKSKSQKIARRYGAKHIFKSRCTKHTILGPLFEVQMSKNCTPLWHKAEHFLKLRCKTHQAQSTFSSSDVEKLHTALAQSTCSTQKVQNIPGSDHFRKF